MIGVVLVALAVPLSAQQSVYGSFAPEDAALVRIVNVDHSREEVSMDLGRRRFGPLEYGSVSPYRPVAPALYVTTLGEEEQEILATAGSYLSVILSPEGVSVLEDTEHDDPARAQLVLYNLTSVDEATLLVLPGEQTVISHVPPMGAASRGVNAVTARLAVESEGERIADLGDVALRRGESFSVFVYPAGDRIHTRVVEATVELEE
jgi:hypothetical protein